MKKFVSRSCFITVAIAVLLSAFTSAAAQTGREGSAAAGPVGRSASASTDVKLNAQILSYSRSRGAFAGLELKGVVIKPDTEDNSQVYGMTAKDILTGANKISMDNMPEGVRVFPLTLPRNSSRRTHSE